PRAVARFLAVDKRRWSAAGAGGVDRLLGGKAAAEGGAVLARARQWAAQNGVEPDYLRGAATKFDDLASASWVDRGQVRAVVDLVGREHRDTVLDVTRMSGRLPTGLDRVEGLDIGLLEVLQIADRAIGDPEDVAVFARATGVTPAKAGADPLAWLKDVA